MITLTEARNALKTEQVKLADLEDMLYSIEESIRIASKLVAELKEEIVLLEAEE